MNNDLYNETIERRGRIYRYDPDFDCYYRIEQEHPVSKWAWILLCIVLAIVCYCIEYRPGLV